MASEIKVEQRLSVLNGNLNFAYPASGFAVSADQAAAGGPSPGMITVGTSEESTAFPELGTLGWLMLHNTDATNYVQWGFSTGVYGGRMEAGEKAGPFRLEPGTTLFLKANTAACLVFVAAFED